MNIKSFLNFDRMITPVIIKIIFYIGLVITAIFALVVFFGGIGGGIVNRDAAMVFGGLLGGPLVLALGVLGIRVYCELLILFFQINETLTDIKGLLKKEE